MPTSFRSSGQIPAPKDSKHYVRALTWLRLNVPELATVGEQEILLYGRSAVDATREEKKGK